MGKYIIKGQIEIIESMKKHWEGLTLFIEMPEIPMDNNLAERMLRKVVLGRKNWYGNHSNWACELSMAMYSIISTCYLLNISPISFYFNQTIEKQKKIQIEKLLPNKLTEEIKKQIIINPP